MRSSILLLAFLCPTIWADEVKMKNGDRLSGQIVRLDDKDLLLKTDYAGDLKIKRESVTAIETSDRVNITLKDGQSLFGQLRIADAKVEVSTETAGTIRASENDVVLFRNKDDQANYLKELDRLRNPRLVDLWTGTVDLGYAQARGNASTNTISSSAKVTRSTTRDGINAYFFSLYSNNKNNGQNVLAANSIRGGIKYDVNITSKFYAFASTDLEFDQFQSLDLRFVPAGGLGHHFLKNKQTVWDFYGGGSLNREFFSTGLNRTSAEILAGNDMSHKFFKIFTLSEKTVFYNNITNSGQYRINSDIAFSIALRRWLSWQVSASDRYLSNPLPGRKKNDLLITTGIRLNFAK
ncbi:DUF481 domain-containing protein [Bryobacter aggregatus]|uniref:DUF481 domain-containing protein n=1 Tax=Bryobacter aggregatus TaxID=360054 RepID=UPI0004E1F03F|nr:DUF481 domain-containing protein [Bryobacter aggregatus]